MQPAEPLELWDSPPFEPEFREGRLYARGSADDKGQLYLHVKAAEAHLKATGKLPVNLIILAEGEEEIGSVNLAPLVEANANRLACDAVIISDTAMFAPGLPCLLFSLRGLAYCEIYVDGPSGDLHSGSYGGPVVNPAMALSQILATLFDDEGRIAIEAVAHTLLDGTILELCFFFIALRNSSIGVCIRHVGSSVYKVPRRAVAGRGVGRPAVKPELL